MTATDKDVIIAALALRLQQNAEDYGFDRIDEDLYNDRNEAVWDEAHAQNVWGALVTEMMRRLNDELSHEDEA